MMIEAYNAESVRHVAISDYVELTKPGITMMVCLTTLSGFFIAGGNSFSLLFLHTVFGTALIASGAVFRRFDNIMQAALDMARNVTKNSQDHDEPDGNN